MKSLESFATCGIDAITQLAALRRLSYGFEKSVRLQPGLLETRRGLFSFSTSELQDSLLPDVHQICTAMQVPQRLLPNILRFCPTAAFVHFGFEHSPDLMICKCYLELPAATDAGPPTERLQFLGFKWTVHSNSVAVVSRYRSLPIRSTEAVTRLLAATDASIHSPMKQLLDHIAPAPHDVSDDIRILEIEDEGSDRRSHDLNVYGRNQLLGPLESPIRELSAALQIPASSIRSWLHQFANSRLGHLATGTNRNQIPFVTIYYDAASIEPVQENFDG